MRALFSGPVLGHLSISNPLRIWLVDKGFKEPNERRSCACLSVLAVLSLLREMGDWKLEAYELSVRHDGK